MNQPFIRRAVIEWEKIGQDSYLRRIPALEGLEALEFDAPVTCFVGENGSGKSTLLEAMAIAAGFNPEGGFRFLLYTIPADMSRWKRCSCSMVTLTSICRITSIT